MEHSSKTKQMILMAMFAAVLVVCSQIAIPTPWGIPITLQTFAVALIGNVLGWRYGAGSTLVYLLLGAIGIPVFAEFSGGFGFLVGMTGGFLISYPFMAILCGIGGQQEKVWLGIFWNLAGLLLCHLMGTVQFAFVSGYNLAEAAMMASIPYMLKDILITGGAFMFARAMVPRLRAAKVL